METPTMSDPSTAQEALNREISERVRQELGNLLQQIIILQVQNDHLKREVERLSSLRAAENDTGNKHYPERVSRSG